MFIVGAVPDSLINMKKKTKPKQKSYKFEEPKDNVSRKAHQSYWSKVTGGRMK